MKTTILLLLSALLASAGIQAQAIWDRTRLEQAKERLEQPSYTAAWKALQARAERLLDARPLSVMMKDKTPASGDKHDYMSLARYYWPDPARPDGLPYINRDGVSNPELEKLDRNRLGETASRITTLSLAWYFSGDEHYARKATELVRAWFFDKATRMNPNLEYAQMIPGRDGGKGRCYGVLDGYSFVEMLDGVQLLEASQSFTREDSRRLKEWFGQLLRWIVDSPQGKEEARQKNNHSVAYDAQVIALALYTGHHQLARQVVESLPTRRIFKQIEPDGSQPQELRRTLGYGYSQYNLTHFIDIFLMARRLGLHPDQAVSADGRSFYKAMDFLARYTGKKVDEWPYQQISGWDEKQQAFCQDLYRCATLLDTSRTDYLELYRKHGKTSPADIFNLLYVQP